MCPTWLDRLNERGKVDRSLLEVLIDKKQKTRCDAGFDVYRVVACLDTVLLQYRINELADQSLLRLR